MNTNELRIGNLINYEACTYEIVGINALGNTILNVKAVNHQWGLEICGVNEVEGLEITKDFLKKNGFEILNRAIPEIWIKSLGGYKYLRYHLAVRYLEFETINSFQRVPWIVKYVHQMQNACNDYGIKIDFKA